MNDVEIHSGRTPADCPVCGSEHRQAVRLAAARPRKVYGRVSENARREHAANQRDARAIFDRLFREHKVDG